VPVEPIVSLWPDDLDLGTVRSPYRILQDQAKHLNEMTGRRIHAYVMPGWGRGGGPGSFMYALQLSPRPATPDDPLARMSRIPDGGMSFSVLHVTHGLQPYPVSVGREGLELENEEQFEAYLRRLFASNEVRHAIRVLSSLSDATLSSPNLLPEEYDLTPVVTPFTILQHQGRALGERTRGAVQGSVSRAAPRENDAGRFAYSFSLHPGMRSAEIYLMSYDMMDIFHGPEIYPVTVRPGDLVFYNEKNFVEFVRQELASKEVRDAIKLIGSVAKMSPLLDPW
jgi:hypothetical protein